VSISINSCSVFVNEMVTYDQNNLVKIPEYPQFLR